jgi:hypothetical protein
MLKVTGVKPLDGHRLEIEFNDGIVRVVDCSFLLHGTLGEPLKDLDYFRQEQPCARRALRGVIRSAPASRAQGE